MAPPRVASREYLTKTHLPPFWITIRLLSLTALSISFLLQLLEAALPAHSLPIATVTAVPTHATGTEKQAAAASSDAAITDTAFSQTYNVHIGVWTACIGQVSTGLFMANPSYDPTDSHSEFLVKLVLLRLHNALEHVAKSMVLVPVAVGLTGLFLFYQLFSFFAYARPTCWKPRKTRDAFLTSHKGGLAIAGLVCATSTLAWVFQIIILAESYFIVDTLLGLRVEDVHVGPAVILGICASVLQLFVLVQQQYLFSEREMRDYAVKPKESTPPLPDMPFRESQLEESLPAYGELSRPASLVDTKEKEASVTEFEAQEDAHDIDLGDRDDKAQDADAHHTAHAL